MKLISRKVEQNRKLLGIKYHLKEVFASPRFIGGYLHEKRSIKYFLDIQNLGELEANDETGLVLRCNNGATKVLWEDIGFIFYNEDAFAAMIIKTHDLLEMGIDNRREHHEAIWQMVLRHCIGREDVKIDPHWQAYWEVHRQA